MPGDSLELVSVSGDLGAAVSFKRGALADRRKRARTRLHLPLLLFRDSDRSAAVHSTTRDLSSSGFYCLSRVQFGVGEQLMCCLRMPTHDPDGQGMVRNLECMVRVLRVVPQESGDAFGIACRIEDYHLSPVRLNEGKK
jgi:hypothetical protein